MEVKYNSLKNGEYAVSMVSSFAVFIKNRIQEDKGKTSSVLVETGDSNPAISAIYAAPNPQTRLSGFNQLHQPENWGELTMAVEYWLSLLKSNSIHRVAVCSQCHSTGQLGRTTSPWTTCFCTIGTSYLNKNYRNKFQPIDQ